MKMAGRNTDVLCEDKGSAVIELCLVAPIVICTVFVAINMLFIVLNYSLAMSETYTVIYDRGMYQIDENGSGDTTAAESSMGRRMCDILMCSDDISTKLSQDGGSSIISGGVKSELEAEISYKEEYVGMELLDLGGEYRWQTTAKQEVRDVGNNLRRWQVYGELLSD